MWYTCSMKYDKGPDLVANTKQIMIVLYLQLKKAFQGPNLLVH